MRTSPLRCWPRWRCVARAALLACLSSAPLLCAQPRITAVAPDWIHRGATLDITITGAGLGSVTGFVFSGEAGLSASALVETSPPPAITVESSSRTISAAGEGPRDSNKTLRARLVAAADAPLGTRELRVVGPDGISSAVNITVGAVPEIAEAEPNNSFDQAQRIEMPAAIVGTIRRTTETDHFRVQARKGEQFVFEVLAQRNGSPLDSSLAILDAQGRELARSEDARGFDSVLAFTAPEDGPYVLQLRDFQYRGGADYRYRLFVGALPFIESIFPFGGQRGKSVEIALKGQNLGTDKITLSIDGKSPLGRQEIRINTPRGLSNPIQFDVENLPELIESEPNHSGTNAPLSVPVMVNGRISPADDVDRFRFKSGSDQKIVCTVEARRFGSSLDPLLAVYAGDKLVAQNDDADGSDARLELDAKKDVEYTVVVRDLTGRGGEQFGYRLALRPPVAPAPALAVKFFPDAIRLHRQGRMHVRCEITRQGFDGPVRVGAEDLPEGVSADPVLIPRGRNEGDLLLVASSSADLGTRPVRIVARANAGDRELLAAATPIALTANAERTFRQGFLTVLDTAPFTIDALTLSATIDQLGKGTLDAHVQRQRGFSGEVKVSAIGFSTKRDPITRSLDVKEVTVKGSDATARLTLSARVDGEAATRAVFLRAEATDNGQSIVQYSQPIAVTVAAIPFVLSAAPTRISLNLPSPGSTNIDEAILKVRVDRRGFTGEIPLTIEGALDGLLVSGTNIPADVAEASVKFTATAASHPLTNISFTVQGAAMHQDRLYRHKTGAVQLSVAPRALEVASTNATDFAKP